MTLKDFFKGDHFAALAGVELLEIGEGHAKACMRVTHELLNGGGWCQGGALFTLADLTFAAAVNSHLQLTVSSSANITYFKSVGEGTMVFADAQELFNHPRLPFAEVRITDDKGQLVALFTSSGYRKHDKPIILDQ